MSTINRDKVRKLILKEFKMMGMADLGHGGMKPMGLTKHLEPEHEMTQVQVGHSHKGSVSREDCCAAVMCVIECCSCPTTRQALIECCRDILAGDYDS